MSKIAILLVAVVLMCSFTGCINVEEAVADMNSQILSQANSADSQAAVSDNGETKETPYTAEELLPMVEELIARGEEVYELFFSDLLPVDTEQQKGDTSFYPVISEDYRTIEDLKAFAESVFTKSFAEATFYTTCIDSEYPMFQMIDGTLCRSVDVASYKTELKWLPETLEIAAQTDKLIKLRINAESADMTVKKELTLALENDQWRLDCSLKQ